jgi:hypothetical protein
MISTVAEQTTPTHDREKSDYPSASFSRGDLESLFIEVDEIEAGAFVRGLFNSLPSWREMRSAPGVTFNHW